MGHDHGVVGGQRLELVGRGCKGKAGDFGDLCRDLFCKACGRGEAGADGGAALGQFHQRGQGHLNAGEAVLDLLCVAGKLLAEGERRCVLRMGAANLDDVRPGLGLGVNGLVQVLECRDQPVHDFLGAGHVHGGRECVIGRLGHVHMVVRVDRLLGALFAAQHLDGAVGDDLVGVHVGLGAGSGLPDHEREVVVELAVDDFLRGGDDGLAEVCIHLAERDVGFGGCPLDDAERADDGLRLLFPANLEVAERALRLRAPVLRGVHLDGAKGIGFSAGRCHCSKHSVGRSEGNGAA